jgi:hypothetical protein
LVSWSVALTVPMSLEFMASEVASCNINGELASKRSLLKL